MRQHLIEQETLQLAFSILRRMRSYEPSFVERRFWADLAMGFLLRCPSLKNESSRLIDAISGMEDKYLVARHIQEYLAPVFPKLLSWPLKALPFPPFSSLAYSLSQLSLRSLARLFIAGETAQETLPQLYKLRQSGFAFTVDLLGEYCVSEVEAKQYMQRYIDCMNIYAEEIGQGTSAREIIRGHRGEASPVCLSVKLTALYSQSSILNEKETVRVLSERLGELLHKAKQKNISVYVDAEDSSHNPLIYKTFSQLAISEEFKDYAGFGIVLQAYLRDSESRLFELIQLAKKRSAPIALRLVKGAYWDTETILAKQNDWHPPVFQKKSSSDAQYEHLTSILLEHRNVCLPAFASHNIRSLSYACAQAKALGMSAQDFELQMLYGMADPIAYAFRDAGYLVRMYVPQGELLPGMGYLVRRLLENTSNESFLRHTFLSGDDARKLFTQPDFAMEDRQ